MSQPYVGEIRMFGGSFAPAGWAFCNGQLIAISDNETLINLIGTTYGGAGQETFALPNLQSRVPVHVGPNFALAQMAGTETVTLTTAQIPGHGHVPECQSANGNQGPGNGVWATDPTANENIYQTAAPDTSLNAGAIGSTGGSQPHDNMIPFLCVNFILSLFGIFPSQT